MDGRTVRDAADGMTIGCVIDALETLGVDADMLARRVAEEAGDMGTPPDRMKLAAAWNVVYPRVVEPYLATFAGEHIPFGTYDVIDYMASACETVGRGIELLGRYFSLIYDRVIFEVGPSTVEFRHPRDAFDVFFDEYTVGIVLSRFRARALEPIRVSRIAFRRGRPGDTMHERLTDYLGSEPTYGAPNTRVVFSDEDWNVPLSKPNKRLELRLIELADEMLAEQRSGPYAATVRAAIVDGLREGDASVQSIADRLATTARTLQRRLKDEGTSFQDQLESMRQQLAECYLQDRRLSIAEVAFLLGYSEASAFARAFRRWTGASPQRFRTA